MHPQPQTSEAQLSKGDEHAVVKVKVEHLASLREVQVEARWTDTARRVWDLAISDPDLNEPRREGDKLQTDDGQDLTPLLDRTLREIQDTGVKSRKWQILGGTGGANR